MIKRTFIDLYKKSIVFHAFDKIISWHYRKKLKNSDFTILCSNCIGGVIYHRLGQQFNSPTINMWMIQPDFVQFLLQLDQYLLEPLVFIKSSEATPVAQLGNGNSLPFIKLHFNHATSQADARNQWERRKTRIRKDNLYIILYNLDGLTVDQLQLLDKYPCNNKVVLTSVPLTDLSWSFYIKENPKSQFPSSYLGKNIFGIRDFEKAFDFVSFLNKK